MLANGIAMWKLDHVHVLCIFAYMGENTFVALECLPKTKKNLNNSATTTQADAAPLLKWPTRTRLLFLQMPVPVTRNKMCLTTTLTNNRMKCTGWTANHLCTLHHAVQNSSTTYSEAKHRLTHSIQQQMTPLLQLCADNSPPPGKQKGKPKEKKMSTSMWQRTSAEKKPKPLQKAKQMESPPGAKWRVNVLSRQQREQSQPRKARSMSWEQSIWALCAKHVVRHLHKSSTW